jgi:hypothetical protein
MLQHFLDRAGDARLLAGLPLVLAGLIGVFRASLRRLLGAALPGRRQVDASPPGLGEPDRDRLLGRARPMLATADILDFFADELARLGGRGLAGAFRLAGLLDGLLPGHVQSPHALVPKHHAS